MRVLAAALFACWVICSEATLSAQSLSEIVSTHSQAIAKSSRKTIQPAIDALVASKLPNVAIDEKTIMTSDGIHQIEDFFVFELAQELILLHNLDQSGPFLLNQFLQI